MSFPMLDEGARLRALSRAKHRAGFLVGASAMVLVAHGVDLVHAGGPNWPALGIRAAWAALLLVAAGTLATGNLRLRPYTSGMAAVGSAVLFTALLAVTGRSRSPLFPFAFVLAVLLPPIAAEFLRVGVAGSALLLAGAWAILLGDGAGAGEQLAWGHAGLVALAAAWLLGASERRNVRFQDRLSAEREAMLRRMGEVERLAEMGALAAEVAHEVNNPLAAARSSASYLAGALPPGDAEARDVSEELIASLDRIASSVRRLNRRAAPPEHAPEADAAEPGSPG